MKEFSFSDNRRTPILATPLKLETKEEFSSKCKPWSGCTNQRTKIYSQGFSEKCTSHSGKCLELENCPRKRLELGIVNFSNGLRVSKEERSASELAWELEQGLKWIYGWHEELFRTFAFIKRGAVLGGS